KSKYGALIPAAMATNIDSMIAGDCENAKPSAVPRNGALHGVASTVANTPWKNEPTSSLRSVVESKPRVMLCGNEISNTPKRLREITDNTHGIKFKMMPPIKPKSRKVKIPRTGAGRAAETAGGVAICHAARSSPFG